MKKTILIIVASFTVASAFAQGTIIFDNHNSVGTTHVWGPGTTTFTLLKFVGFGPNDTPSGTTDFAGAGMSLIGSSGVGGQFGAGTTLIQLLAVQGSNAVEASLVPQGSPTTFRTGAGAGLIANGPITITLNNVAADAPAATVELVAWDDSSGLYSTWTQAQIAWLNGLIAGGESGTINVFNIGGNANVPPAFLSPSFNLYFTPEPSTAALACLGAAACLVLRGRRSN